MRKALNDNPVVQIAVVGVLIVFVGLFLMLSMKKKSPDSSSAAPSAAPAAQSSASSAGTTTPVQVPAGAVPDASAGSVSGAP